MWRPSAFHFLSFFLILPIVRSHETPSLEVVVVIKATTELTNQTYFNYEILPFVEELSNFLTFPEEIGQGQTDFARISINIGGNDNVWPEVPLKNLSRHAFSDVVQKLVLVDANDTVSGCERALEAALQTYYSSSVALYRVTVLITDSVSPSDAVSLAAQSLQSISNAIYIVGIPSTDNSNFNDSLASAQKLAQLPDKVFPTIEAAANTSSGLGVFIQAAMEASSKPCAGYVFAYESSGINASLLLAYVEAAESFAKGYLSDTEAFGISSFWNIANDRFAFLPLSKFDVDSVSKDENVDITSVQNSLWKLNLRSKFTYMGIVLLTHQGSTPENAEISVSRTTLGNLTNADLFVFKVSNSNSSKSAAADINAEKQASYLNPNILKFDHVFKDHVLPVFGSSQCGVPVTETTVDSDTSTSTVPVTSTPPVDSETTQPTGGGSCVAASAIVFAAYFVAWFFVL
uniref:VWFA domain-containing protein n=1 Tax=Panagrellus redivivus TaxID=6233 RepID=A0A7E4W788_PANRE